MFQHIPYFDKAPDEADDYFNIPEPARRRYLDLLKDTGVRYVFAGHLHRNAIAKDGPLTEVVTGAVGMPLGGSLSGFRIVVVDAQELHPCGTALLEYPTRSTCKTRMQPHVRSRSIQTHQSPEGHRHVSQR